jgi:N4-gp56 family major capsid protein
MYFEGAAQASDTDDNALAYAILVAEKKVVAWCRDALGMQSQIFNHASNLSVAGQTTPASGGTIANGTGSAFLAGWTYEHYKQRTAADDGFTFGNLYGSSKDVGVITGKLPAVGELGGRVNRVGMTRLTLEGTIEKFGFFTEYSAESLDFDNDAELESHITTEAVKAANEITEDQLQLDLLTNAGIIRYTGDATSAVTLAGASVGGTPDTLVYADLVKLSIELDNNRCPKNTKVITGSRMIDTKVVNAARYAYIGSELVPTLMKLVDYHNNPAFIPVAQYGAATTIARGEIGAVADFRFIVVPEMMHWSGAGASPAGNDEICMTGPDTAGALKINVYPILVVGDGSFTTIGFQTDGKGVKFRIKHVKPGSDSSYSRDDPYGEVGYYSIKWWYGFMALRPERLALIKTVALM